MMRSDLWEFFARSSDTDTKYNYGPFIGNGMGARAGGVEMMTMREGVSELKAGLWTKWYSLWCDVIEWKPSRTGVSSSSQTFPSCSSLGKNEDWAQPFSPSFSPRFFMRLLFWYEPYIFWRPQSGWYDTLILFSRSGTCSVLYQHCMYVQRVLRV